MCVIREIICYNTLSYVPGLSNYLTHRERLIEVDRLRNVLAIFDRVLQRDIRKSQVGSSTTTRGSGIIRLAGPCNVRAARERQLKGKPRTLQGLYLTKG